MQEDKKDLALCCIFWVTASYGWQIILEIALKMHHVNDVVWVQIRLTFLLQIGFQFIVSCWVLTLVGLSRVE